MSNSIRPARARMWLKHRAQLNRQHKSASGTMQNIVIIHMKRSCPEQCSQIGRKFLFNLISALVAFALFLRFVLCICLYVASYFVAGGEATCHSFVLSFPVAGRESEHLNVARTAQTRRGAHFRKTCCQNGCCKCDTHFIREP